MIEPIYDGNKSIEEIRPNEFWYCENREPKNKLDPKGRKGKLSFFKEYEGERYIVGTVGKIEPFKDYRECYKKYQFPKSTTGESRKC